nr:reverse transcriptase domain-containing protein [Tanacetum cinerariifolium]
MEDQPLPADASPTALSPGYVVDSDPEKDEKDPKEDPANYPADRGDNDNDESSNDDDDRVANAIEAIAIYERKTNIALKSMSQTERQEEKVAENASNKRKWESNHNGSLSQQNKGHKVPRAHTAWPINKKAHDGSLPLCNQCKFHHSGSCTVKCGNYKKVGHIIQNCRTPATAKNQRTRTCYECGSLRHYKSKCPIVKFHKRVDMIHGRVRTSKPKTMQDAIEFATKLMNKKISTLVGCQTENKKRRVVPRNYNTKGERFSIASRFPTPPLASLSPGYIVDSDPEKDEKDPKEDPVDRGNNDEDESSNDDDDDDDDVEKDEEDKEEEEHLASTDPLMYLQMILSPQAENTKAFETYESASTPSTIFLPPPLENIKSLKDYIRETMTTVNQGMRVKEIKTHATAKNQRTCTCYECGSLRHYKGECPIVKFHKCVDMIHGRVRASKPKTMQDAIEIATKLMNKKISTLVECQTEDKKRLDNTSKNNQNQQ